MEFHDIFAWHRFDIGIDSELEVQLTPSDNRPAYSQSLPAPINFKDDILVELALLYKYGIIITLPFSKYASPILAQRKPNGKLRLLVDFRKFNTLIADEYTNNNHPVSTLPDAAQHMTGIKVLQTWLFISVSPPPKGQPAVNRNSCIQLRKQNIRIPIIGKRF